MSALAGTSEHLPEARRLALAWHESCFVTVGSMRPSTNLRAVIPLPVLIAGCVAPGLHGGGALALGTDGRAAVTLTAGADGGFTGSDVDAANALVLPAIEGQVGIDVRSARPIAGVRIGVGFARQVADADWGQRGTAGVQFRFSRRRITVGPSVQYFREHVTRASFEPGPCADEGTYSFGSLGVGLSADLGFAIAGRPEGRTRVLTLVLGGHYLWSWYYHVHPLTECPGP